MRKLIFIIGIFSSMTLFGQFAEDAAALLENQYGFGAKSIGMGSAFTAVSDDYSAIYWNPAGLAQIKKMEFYAGLSHLSYNSDATYLGNQLNSSENFTKLSSIGLVFPVPTYQGSLVFALGYQRVKDFDNTLKFGGFNLNSNDLFIPYDTVDYYFDKNIYQEELVQEDGNLNNWSFAGAMDISPNVSVGVTLNFWTGSSSYIFDLLQSDINGVYPDSIPDTQYNPPRNRNLDIDSYLLSQKLLSDYSGFQMKLGALLRPSENFRVGLNISLPYTMNIVEKFNVNDVVVYDDGVEDPVEGDPSEFEYDVSLPFQFGMGAAYKFDNLTVSLDLEYLDVSQVEFELPSDAGLNSDYSALLDENTRIKEIYQSKLKLKAGAEYFWEDQNLMFRGGYMLDPSSLLDAPSDYDRQFLTGGVGIIVDKQFIIDLAYMYGYWKNFSSDSYTPAGTDEDITYQKIFLTTSFRF
jgi:long-subunit fatty acid transport protein